jgi:ribosomal peptide maturation radical SAM protein 1
MNAALAFLPFGAAHVPSIQLGLLKAIGERAGHRVDTFHFTIELAARIGHDSYRLLSQHRGHLLGEWLFSVAAFGSDVVGRDEEFFKSFPDEERWAVRHWGSTRFLSQLRHETLPAFISEVTETIEWLRYDFIGFSSCFQQNVASLALARAIKARTPTAMLCFGGANVEGAMGHELIRAFPFIDAVVPGEGDLAFPALLNWLSEPDVMRLPEGVLLRVGPDVIGTGSSSRLTDMDSLPVPIYEEYFERVAASGVDRRWLPQSLPIETSRGCWWGEKHHCTFCGLNGSTMRYRSKSPERVLSELDELAAKHHITTFDAVDNILDVRAIEPLFGAIARDRLDYRFFFEVKANLRQSQLKQLRDAGLYMVQPGIESLSTRLLRLMRKGTTALRNLLLLQLCAYYDIRVAWNVLLGVPGEQENDYRLQLDLMRLATHLEPPASCSRIWLERFSPLFTDRTAFGITEVRPERSYDHVYPSHVDLTRMAYFFDYSCHETLPDTAYGETKQFVREWQDSWQVSHRPRLTLRRMRQGVLVDDARSDPRHASTTLIEGVAAAAYESCVGAIRSPATVRDFIACRLRLPEEALPVTDIRPLLMAFCRNGLMVAEDDKYLALAIPSNPYWYTDDSRD